MSLRRMTRMILAFVLRMFMLTPQAVFLWWVAFGDYQLPHGLTGLVIGIMAIALVHLDDLLIWFGDRPDRVRARAAAGEDR